MRDTRTPTTDQNRPNTYLFTRLASPTPTRSVNEEVDQLRPRSRFLKLRSFGFSPQRGSRKSAQGKRPTGAPPWVFTVTEFEALKGRPYIVHQNSAAPSGLCFPDKPPTQGVALGWHSVAPLGLKSQIEQLQNSRCGLVFGSIISCRSPKPASKPEAHSASVAGAALFCRNSTPPHSSDGRRLAHESPSCNAGGVHEE